MPGKAVRRAILSLLAALCAEPAFAQSPQNEEAAEDEVVVSGEQPGPGLWKVSDGSHVMWVLGTLEPVPKNMQWRSRQVEEVIASSRQILDIEEVDPGIGFFRGIRLLPSVMRARFNAEGAVLKDLVEPDVYARWLPLRKKYFKDDEDVEKVRPMFLAFQLYAKATSEAGLTRDSPVWKFLKQAARKHDIRITTPQVKVKIKDPRQAIRDFTQTPRAADVACFVATLERLEADVDAMKRRANAWATGDVEALRAIPRPVQEEACRDAVTSAPGLQDELGHIRDETLYTWLFEALAALRRNDVTFAVLPISNLLRDDGRLAELRARGYTIEPPAN
jgi:uncharacterized protein YbaP (TraB family)